MIIKRFLIVTVTCALLGIAAMAESGKGNLAKFLAAELIRFGGKENNLSKKSLPAEWAVKRDALGAVINVTDGDYQSLTNVLTAEFGAPDLYVKPKGNRKAIFRYPWTTAGVFIFVREETVPENVEIVLTKPIR